MLTTTSSRRTVGTAVMGDCLKQVRWFVRFAFAANMMVGEVEVKERPRPSPDYLMQLLNEKKLMTSLPNLCGIFTHLERLLDEGKPGQPWTCLGECVSGGARGSLCRDRRRRHGQKQPKNNQDWGQTLSR
uniref:STAR protein homodimerisation region domain-containing protein n=1 Tax=Knipowitschia caucasica TaxID=637954 RepID=A0AAV2JKZ6_KNICA